MGREGVGGGRDEAQVHAWKKRLQVRRLTAANIYSLNQQAEPKSGSRAAAAVRFEVGERVGFLYFWSHHCTKWRILFALHLLPLDNRESINTFMIKLLMVKSISNINR